MIYTRGNPEDYRRWSDRNEGWSYAEVLPYYKKSEDCHLETQTCTDGFHSTGGYLSLERPFSSPLTDAFIEGGAYYVQPSTLTELVKKFVQNSR